MEIIVSDAKESGVTGVLVSGSVAQGPYGANGLANGIETNVDSGIVAYTSTYVNQALVFSSMPPLLSITNSLNSTNSLQWATLSNITSTSATGTLPNGVSATITHSAGGMQTHNGMVSGSNFPNQFSVPGNGSSVIRNDLAGTITVCFSSPVTNPVIAFASIGQPGSCIQVTTSSPYSQVWSGSDVTYNSDTMFTGCEGFTIIRIPGTHSCISYFYASPEIYSTMAFGI